MSLHRHALRLLLSGMLALGLALSSFAAPAAHANPRVAGDYVKMSHKRLAYVVPSETRDLIRFNYRADLEAMGAAVEAKGYTYNDGSAPVYTKLYWDVQVVVKGPRGYYDTFKFTNDAPDDSLEWVFRPSRYKFSGNKTRAGKYTVEHRIVAGARRLGIAGGNSWPYAYQTVWEKTVTQKIRVKSLAACQKAKKKVKKAKAQVKKAKGKKVKKKAKTTLRKAKVKKRKAC